MDKIRIKLIAAAVAILSAMLVTACGDDSFKVKGNIEGAADQPVVIEKSGYMGEWIAVDSTRTDGKGRFSLKVAAPAAPEIYRVAVGGQYVYFPVDSIETVTMSGKLANLSSIHTLEGSEQAGRFAGFDKELSEAISKGTTDMKVFKRNVYQKYLRDDKGGLLSYYVLTKTVDGRPLYDVSDKDDARYYAAVATAFRQFRPGDPRVDYLEKTALKGMRNRKGNEGRQNVVEANTVNMIEIELPDVNGVDRRLSDELSHGQATVVIFSLMVEPDSPAVNKRLAEILASKGGRVRFYQISYDRDMYAWRDAARNLPWTNVYDVDGQTSLIPAKYNLRNMPSFYIYSPEGELEGRAESLDQLNKSLAKY